VLRVVAIATILIVYGYLLAVNLKSPNSRGCADRAKASKPLPQASRSLRSSEAAHRCSPRPIRPGIFHRRRWLEPSGACLSPTVKRTSRMPSRGAFVRSKALSEELRLSFDSEPELPRAMKGTGRCAVQR
jgi:hypothetical protein